MDARNLPRRVDLALVGQHLDQRLHRVLPPTARRRMSGPVRSLWSRPELVPQPSDGAGPHVVRLIARFGHHSAVPGQ